MKRKFYKLSVQRHFTLDSDKVHKQGGPLNVLNMAANNPDLGTHRLLKWTEGSRLRRVVPSSGIQACLGFLGNQEHSPLFQGTVSLH